MGSAGAARCVRAFIYQTVDQEYPKRAITQRKRGFLTLPINELRDLQEGLAKMRDYP